MAFIHKTLPLKITVDRNLKAKKDNCMIPFNDLMIIELKSRKNEAASAACIIESQYIQPCNVSKYSIGMVTLHPELKNNKLKSTLLQIKKLAKI